MWSKDRCSGSSQVPRTGNGRAVPAGALPNALLIEADIVQVQPLGIGFHLWSSDGTAENTARLGAVTVADAFLDNGVVAFLAGLGDAGPEPWAAPSTSASPAFFSRDTSSSRVNAMVTPSDSEQGPMRPFEQAEQPLESSGRSAHQGVGCLFVCLCVSVCFGSCFRLRLGCFSA